VTDAQIAPIPDAVFAAPAPVREHPDQRYLVEAAKTLRQAVREFEGGDLQGFLLSLKRASFLVGIYPSGHTPSEGRVMSAINRVAFAASDRLRIVRSGRGGRR